MQLTNPAAEEVQITIAGYEFPGTGNRIPTDKYDLNWLKITVQARHAQGTWRATDPCLLTWEIADLIQWFAHIRNGNPVDESVDIIEPCVRFRLVSENPPTIRISLGHEFRPPWIENVTGSISMDFPLDAATLTASILSLQTQLAQYPARTKVAGTTPD